MPELRFDPASHTYWMGDRRVPSVTQILGIMTDLEDIKRMRPGVIEHAADRGDAAHYGCELFDKGILDWDTVDEEIRPYIEAWADFRAKTGFEPDRIEAKVFHPGLIYAGTLDRTGTYEGEHALVDIKCVAAMYPTTGPQTAAYAEAIHAAEPATPKLTARYAVQLQPDGKWKLHPYRERSDFSVFVAARTLMGWADKNQQAIAYNPKEAK